MQLYYNGLYRSFLCSMLVWCHMHTSSIIGAMLGSCKSCWRRRPLRLMSVIHQVYRVVQNQYVCRQYATPLPPPTPLYYPHCCWQIHTLFPLTVPLTVALIWPPSRGAGTSVPASTRCLIPLTVRSTSLLCLNLASWWANSTGALVNQTMTSSTETQSRCGGGVKHQNTIGVMLSQVESSHPAKRTHCCMSPPKWSLAYNLRLNNVDLRTEISAIIEQQDTTAAGMSPPYLYSSSIAIILTFILWWALFATKEFVH